MAHAEQHAFIDLLRYRFPGWFIGSKVLEVGSFDINGSVRQFFHAPEIYIGLDLAEGKGVDVVCHGADYVSEFKFDVVVSTEAFEHDERWVQTFNNMIDLCRQGGLIIVTCAAHNRPEHGTTRTSPSDNAIETDYYQNLNVLDFEARWGLKDEFVHYGLEARDNDLYVFGIKR